MTKGENHMILELLYDNNNVNESKSVKVEIKKLNP